MDNEEISLYTPLVLRTGFMHSYRRTGGLLLSLILLEALFWTLGGFWPRFEALGLQRWGLIAILGLVVPVGISTIRDIVAGYWGLFDLLDERTAANLKPYRSLRRPASASHPSMQRLFKDEGTYAAFQDQIRQVLFDKTTDISVVATSVGISIFVLYNTVVEKVVLRASLARSSLRILEVFIDAYATIFLILALSYILTFGGGYFYTLYRLGRSQSDLGVWNTIQHLGGTPVQEGSLMSYWRFLDYASAIGQHFSRIAFRIVLLMTVGGLAQVLYNVSTSTLVAWILAAIPVVLSVLILILPLHSLHQVMQRAKNAVLRELEEAYDHLTLRFITDLAAQRHARSTGRAGEAGEDLAVKVTSLRGIIEETREQSTWPVPRPLAFRIISPSLIPIAISLFKFLRDLGIIQI